MTEHIDLAARLIARHKIAQYAGAQLRRGARHQRDDDNRCLLRLFGSAATPTLPLRVAPAFSSVVLPADVDAQSCRPGRGLPLPPPPSSTSTSRRRRRRRRRWR